MCTLVKCDTKVHCHTFSLASLKFCIVCGYFPFYSEGSFIACSDHEELLVCCVGAVGPVSDGY